MLTCRTKRLASQELVSYLTPWGLCQIPRESKKSPIVFVVAIFLFCLGGWVWVVSAGHTIKTRWSCRTHNTVRVRVVWLSMPLLAYATLVNIQKRAVRGAFDRQNTSSIKPKITTTTKNSLSLFFPTWPSRAELRIYFRNASGGPAHVQCTSAHDFPEAKGEEWLN